MNYTWVGKYADVKKYVNAFIVCSISKNSSSKPVYHPQGNGQCERMNRSILNLLRTLCEAEKKKWPLHLSKIIHAYNSTPHASTGYSPFYLMFDHEENLPIDAVYSIDRTGSDMSWVKETKNKVCEINKRVQ